MWKLKERKFLPMKSKWQLDSFETHGLDERSLAMRLMNRLIHPNSYFDMKLINKHLNTNIVSIANLKLRGILR